MAGKGVLPSRDQSVRQARALSPRSLAHRSISGAPILSVPSRCAICPASAATPWRCSSVTRASRPGSVGLALLVSMLMGALQGDVASGGVRLRQLRLLARRRIGNRHRAVAFTRRDEARRHELAQQGGSSRPASRRRRRRCGSPSAWIRMLLPVPPSRMSCPPPPIRMSSPAPPFSVSLPATADQDVVAVAAIGGEQHAGRRARTR